MPVAAIAAIRRTEIMECGLTEPASLRLDVGPLDYSRPLLGVIGDEFPEIGGRAYKRCAS